MDEGPWGRLEVLRLMGPETMTPGMQGFGPRDWVRTGLRRFRWCFAALGIALAAMGQDPALQVISMIPFLLCWPAALTCLLIAARKPSHRHLLVWAVLAPASATGGFLVGVVVYEARVARAEAAGDRIAVALKTFQKTHGRYPDQLADLVPVFLPQPPGPALASMIWDCPFSYELRDGGYRLSFPVGVFMQNILEGPLDDVSLRDRPTGWFRHD